MKAAQWIDKIKETHNLPSDYAAAKLVGISRFTVSGYRNRPDATLDEEIAYKVAQVMKIDVSAVILDQVAERSKVPEIRTALHKLANRLCILCKQAVASFFVAAHA